MRPLNFRGLPEWIATQQNNQVLRSYKSYYACGVAKMLRRVASDNQRNTEELPDEVIEMILEHLGQIITRRPAIMDKYKKKASSRFVSVGHELIPSRPPASGKCYFMDLPAELQRNIFAAAFPSRDIIIAPTCASRPSRRMSDNERPRTNRVADLMTLNKAICEVVTEAVYEERTFGIHVHQGFKNAGLEFLHVGRQSLQYLDNISDDRFNKFRGGDKFGFCRLRKIDIIIFPSEQDSSRHTAINTYFMILALTKLIDRDGSDEKHRITSLRVRFYLRALRDPDEGPQAADNPWWDFDNNRPRESSVHGIPDVELVMRPLANLSQVHNVKIDLPPLIATHPATVGFTNLLKRSMEAPYMQGIFSDDLLEYKIETARYALEAFINKTLYGGTWAEVPYLTAEELASDQPVVDVSSLALDEDEDEGINASGDTLAWPRDTDSGLKKKVRFASKKETQDLTTNDLASRMTTADDDPFVDTNTQEPFSSEDVAALMDLFGVDADVARTYLRISDGVVEQAIDLFFNLGSGSDVLVGLPPGIHAGQAGAYAHWRNQSGFRQQTNHFLDAPEPKSKKPKSRQNYGMSTSLMNESGDAFPQPAPKKKRGRRGKKKKGTKQESEATLDPMAPQFDFDEGNLFIELPWGRRNMESSDSLATQMSSAATGPYSEYPRGSDDRASMSSTTNDDQNVFIALPSGRRNIGSWGNFETQMSPAAMGRHDEDTPGSGHRASMSSMTNAFASGNSPTAGLYNPSPATPAFRPYMGDGSYRQAFGGNATMMSMPATTYQGPSYPVAPSSGASFAETNANYQQRHGSSASTNNAPLQTGFQPASSAFGGSSYTFPAYPGAQGLAAGTAAPTHPQLQHSGLSDIVEDMSVNPDEPSPTGGVALNDDSLHDSGF